MWVKDWERFLRGLSSKNSMMKACWLRCSGGPCGAVWLGDPWPGGDPWFGGSRTGVWLGGEWLCGGVRDSDSGKVGETTAGAGGAARCWEPADRPDLTVCWETSDWSVWTEWLDLLRRPPRTGSSESLWVPSSWW